MPARLEGFFARPRFRSSCAAVQDFKIDRVIEVVTVIGDLVREIRDLRFERWATILCKISRSGRFQSDEMLRVSADPRALRMSDSNPKNSDRIFQEFDHSHTLTVMIEAAVVAHAFSQHLFARMSKRRVSQIVRKRDRFRQIFIKA